MSLASINKLFRLSSFLFLLLWMAANSNNVSTASDVVISESDTVGEQSNVGHARSSNSRNRSHRMTPVDEAQWHRKRRRPTTQFIGIKLTHNRHQKKFDPNCPSSLRSKNYNAIPLVNLAWPKPKMSDHNYNTRISKNMFNWTAPVSWEDQEEDLSYGSWIFHNFTEINFINVSLIVHDFKDRVITNGTMIYGRVTKTVSAPSPSIDIYIRPDEYYKRMMVANLTVLEGDIIRNGVTLVPCEIINAEIVEMKESERNITLMWRGTIPKIRLVPLSKPSKVNLTLQVDRITNVKYVNNTLTHGIAMVTIDDKSYINIPLKNINLGNATVVDGKVSNVTIACATLFNENSIIIGNVINQTLTDLTLTNVNVIGVRQVMGKITGGKIDTVTVGSKTYRNVIINDVDIVGKLSEKARLRKVTISHATLINGHLITSGKIRGNTPNIKIYTTKTISTKKIAGAPTKKPRTNNTTSNATIGRAQKNGNLVERMTANVTARNKSYPNVQTKNVTMGNTFDENGTFPNVTISIVTLINWTSIANDVFYKNLSKKPNQRPVTRLTVSNITIENIGVNEGRMTDGLIIIVTIGNEVKFNRAIAKVTISNVTLVHGSKLISVKTANQFQIKKTGEGTFKNITISNVTIDNEVVNKELHNLTISGVTISNVKICEGKVAHGIIDKIIVRKKSYHHVNVANVAMGNATVVNGKLSNVTIINATLVNGTAIKSGFIITPTTIRSLDTSKTTSKLVANLHITIAGVKIEQDRITIANVTIGNITYPNVTITNTIINIAKMGDGPIYKSANTKAAKTNSTSNISGITASDTDVNTTIIDRSLSNVTFNNATNPNIENVSGDICECTTPIPTSREESHQCVTRVICLISTPRAITTTACPASSSHQTTSSTLKSSTGRVRLTPTTTKSTKKKRKLNRRVQRRDRLQQTNIYEMGSIPFGYQ